MRKIIHFFDILSSEETVYDALTTIKGLSGWWTTDVSGEMAVGKVIEFTFISQFNPQMLILSLIPTTRVEWKCLDGHDLWKGDVLTWNLEEDEDCTHVMLTHELVNEEVDDEDYGMYNFNWAYYLNNLTDYCEHGKAKPFKPN